MKTTYRQDPIINYKQYNQIENENKYSDENSPYQDLKILPWAKIELFCKHLPFSQFILYFKKLMSRVFFK